MYILPAIDIKDGKCVRLYQGDYSTAQTVAEDYLQTAQSFVEAGAEWIHMVDLDGAKAACGVNNQIFVDVASKTSLKVEVGGGIRSLDAVEHYLSKGIERVIIGSAAIKRPEFVAEAIHRFGAQHIAVGIDAKNGFVAAEGWLEQTNIFYVTFALELINMGLEYIIFTDISKDGTLAGVNAKMLQELKDAVKGRCNIIASGGVRSLDDIQICADMGLYGTICGKSIYSGTLSLEDAIRIAR